MIYSIMHRGSGLGNQLCRYVGARIIAKKTDNKFGVVAPELFKGKSFLNLDMGEPSPDYHIEEPAGKVIPHTHHPVIDGEFQGEEYFSGGLKDVREWLHVKHLQIPDDVCVINFRGGEYKYFPELYLNQEYWDEAISIVRGQYPNIRFEVHTDDEEEARKFFPEFQIYKNMELNWRAIRYAKHLIISNSSFAILPAYLNEEVKEIIAPKYWARHNKGYWSLPENEYSKFIYI